MWEPEFRPAGYRPLGHGIDFASAAPNPRNRRAARGAVRRLALALCWELGEGGRVGSSADASALAAAFTQRLPAPSGDLTIVNRLRNWGGIRPGTRRRH